MVNSMKAFRLMATFAVAVFLVACEHGGAKVSGGRFIEGNENADSLWTALEGRFQMNNRLDPVEIKVAFLDEKLDSVGELETRLIRQRDGSITFVSDSLDFPTPYLRIAFTCVYPGSSNGLRMDFEQYVDTSSKRLRDSYRKYWMDRQSQLQETFNKSNVDNVSIATNEDFVKSLLMLFKRRS